MTIKERILFGTLTGALAVGSVVAQVLIHEYSKVSDDRDTAYGQLAYLISILAENGIDVNLIGDLTVVTQPTDRPSTNES